MFRPVESNVKFRPSEADVSRFWKEPAFTTNRSPAGRRAKIRLLRRAPHRQRPAHPGHCLTRAIKDLFPAIARLRGYLCERRAGWDTHGLPVEVEVCKELGIHSKADIEAFGVEPFIHKCQQSVWRYMKEWERLTERLGFGSAWTTLTSPITKATWKAFGRRWPSCSTAGCFIRGINRLVVGPRGDGVVGRRSGTGYREVADPSVYVLFPLLDDAGQKTDTICWSGPPRLGRCEQSVRRRASGIDLRGGA